MVHRCADHGPEKRLPTEASIGRETSFGRKTSIGVNDREPPAHASSSPMPDPLSLRARTDEQDTPTISATFAIKKPRCQHRG